MMPESNDDVQVAGRLGATPIGLAAVAGALAKWDDLDETVRGIYAARRHSRDRAAPDLGRDS
jgi:hypothetical protein